MRVTIIATGFAHAQNGINSIAQKAGAGAAPTAEEAPAQEENQTEFFIDDNVKSAIEEVLEDKKGIDAQGSDVNTTANTFERAETIVNTIPSRTNSQDTYKEYDNLFDRLARKKRQ